MNHITFDDRGQDRLIARVHDIKAEFALKLFFCHTFCQY